MEQGGQDTAGEDGTSGEILYFSTEKQLALPQCELYENILPKASFFCSFVVH